MYIPSIYTYKRAPNLAPKLCPVGPKTEDPGACCRNEKTVENVTFERPRDLVKTGRTGFLFPAKLSNGFWRVLGLRFGWFWSLVWTPSQAAFGNVFKICVASLRSFRELVLVLHGFRVSFGVLVAALFICRKVTEMSQTPALDLKALSVTFL